MGHGFLMLFDPLGLRQNRSALLVVEPYPSEK